MTSPVNPIQISGLFTYPIKGAAGLSHKTIELDERGPVWDRRWMVVDLEGLFVTQREVSRLALIQPSFDGDHLKISAAGAGEICIPLQRERAGVQPVTVWHSVCDAWDEGDEAAEWFSSYLNADVRLTRIADDFQRVIDNEYSRRSARPVTHTGFADGFPLLIASEESLEALNQRMIERGAAPVPMNRFRPNVVVKGCDPFAEDTWRTIEIDGLTLDVVKPCARCVVTTVDQVTGIPNKAEPLATLNTFRKEERGVMFAQNVIHRTTGRLSVGDAIQVHTYRD